MAGALDDVAGSIDDIAGSFDDVIGSIDDVAGSVDDVAGSIDDVAGSVDDVTGSVDDVSGSVDSGTSMLDNGAKILSGLGTLGGITLTIIFFTAPKLLGKGMATIAEELAKPAAAAADSFFDKLGLKGVGTFIKKYAKYILLSFILCCIISTVISIRR